jgi:hypothetical protein
VNIVILDFYNLNLYIQFTNKEYHWTNATDFVNNTGYPFTNTRFLSYEPERNIYHVDRTDNTFSADIEAPEIQWIISNQDNLLATISALALSTALVITLEMQRAQYLYDTDWLVQRHQEEIMRSVPTTLSAQQFTDLLNYKQQLRDLTNQYSKETSTQAVVWPINPIR